MVSSDNHSDYNDTTEVTPLLADNSVAKSKTDRTAVGETAQNNNEYSSSCTAGQSKLADAEIDKPLPKAQLALLCYARLVEPIAFFSIFPFVNRMVEINGHLDPADVGFYAGLIESLFSLTQIPFMVIWGRLSDRFGRKPMLVVSLAGVSITTACFGLAKTILQMILFRCFSGVFAGSVVTIRTMIAEHSTPKTQARAYSWFMMSSNMGIFFGPLIGGALADPVRQYPGAFGGSVFFTEYPYALATFATGGFAVTAFLVATFFVKETLVRKESRSRSPRSEAANGPAVANIDSNTQEDSSSEVSAGAASTWSVFMSPGVRPVLYISTHVMLLGYAYTALAPLFFYEPVQLGGFGFSELYISLVMGMTGLAQAVWLLAVFTPLQHKVGTVGVLRGCADAWPLLFITCPLLNLLLRLDTHAARTAFWVLAPTTLSLGVGVSMAFTAVQLAVNDTAPNSQTLGTLSGLSLAATAAVRAVAPVATTSLYAWGIRNKILSAHFIWVVLVVLACALAVAVRLLLVDVDGRVRTKSRHEENERNQGRLR